jgi:hypothetical protein
MLPEHAQKLARMPDDQRQRVLERAAIIFDIGGVTWSEADRLALEIEATQRQLFGGGR